MTPPPERITIAELARRCGVSPGTVSRALNGYADVSPRTRARIEALARELGYEPADAARTLATRRSQLVGAFLGHCAGDPEREQPFFRSVVGALGDALREHGYDLVLIEPVPGEGPSLLHHCRRRQLDGAVLMSLDARDPQIAEIDASEIPVVGIDIDLAGATSGRVTADHAGGTALAVAHLAALGHRRIAAVAAPESTVAGRERLVGYRSGLAAAGLPFDADLVAVGDYSVRSGETAATMLLALAQRPTAIVAASDLMAVGAARAVAAAGLRVPQDVSVVGFDDLPLAPLVEPSLTTLRQDPWRLGAAAADALVERMHGHAGAPARTVEVDLVVRGSTTAARP